MSSSRDKLLIRRSFAAAANTYDDMAELQRWVGTELLKRCPLSMPYGRVLDLGCGTGFLAAEMAKNADLEPWVIDIALPMLFESRRKYPDQVMWRVCADAEQLPVLDHSLDHLYSNLAFQWLELPGNTFADFRRVLKPGGKLVFATFGPDTLKELKAAWASVDEGVHVNRFLSKAEVLHFLKRAGFQTTKFQSESLSREYASVMALMQELKGLGAHHVNQVSQRKPTTKAQLQRMMQNYETKCAISPVVATYEIFFVEAFA